MAPPTFFCSHFCKNGHLDLWSFSKFLFGKYGHVYMPDFQGEYEFHTYRSVEDHLEGPGLLQEQHTHGLRPGITYILKTYM